MYVNIDESGKEKIIIKFGKIEGNARLREESLGECFYVLRSEFFVLHGGILLRESSRAVILERSEGSVRHTFLPSGILRRRSRMTWTERCCGRGKNKNRVSHEVSATLLRFGYISL